MVKPIMRDIFFLNQPSEPATESEPEDRDGSAGYFEGT